jgi:hypothetical protein
MNTVHGDLVRWQVCFHLLLTRTNLSLCIVLLHSLNTVLCVQIIRFLKQARLAASSSTNIHTP